MSQREGSNGFDGDQLKAFLQEIDKADDTLIKLKAEHMSACKAPRGRIRAVMKEARESGINIEAFRAVLKAHRSDRKIEHRLAELEADDLADYEAMQEALGAFGDTELGAAALERAKPKGDTLATLRPQ